MNAQEWEQLLDGVDFKEEINIPTEVRNAYRSMFMALINQQINEQYETVMDELRGVLQCFDLAFDHLDIFKYYILLHLIYDLAYPRSEVSAGYYLAQRPVVFLVAYLLGFGTAWRVLNRHKKPWWKRIAALFSRL